MDLPLGQCFITGVELVVVEVGPLQQHLYLLLPLFKAHLLLQVRLLLLVDVRDADLSLDELPKDFLKWHETAIAFVDGLPHGVNVHHFPCSLL